MGILKTYDYETLEEHLGAILRKSDNIDFHSDNFFPVSLLDKLFHFSEKLSVIENRHEKNSFKNFHGHDFDRWIDNMIASTSLLLQDDNKEITEINLIDIDCININEETGETTVVLPNETIYRLMAKTGETDRHEMKLHSLEEMSVSLDLSGVSYDAVTDDNEPYQGFGGLAHVFRVVCEKSSINPTSVNAAKLSDKIFELLKFELLPLIPSLWNDMEIIYDTVRAELTHCSKQC